MSFVYNIKLIRLGLQCARENTWAAHLQHAYDDIIYSTVQYSVDLIWGALILFNLSNVNLG